MAETINNAAHSSVAATEASLYIAPSGGSDLGAIVQNLFVCNGTTGSVTFSIWRTIGGGVGATAGRYYFDHPLASKRSFECTIGMSLTPGDEIRVESDTTGVSFNISVLEVDST